MSRTRKDIAADFAKLEVEFNALEDKDHARGGKAETIVREMNKLADERDALHGAQRAKELEEYSVETLAEVLAEHYLLHSGVLCACGRKFETATLKNTRTQHARHVAESLVGSGWRNTLDQFFNARDPHPGEDWT